LRRARHDWLTVAMGFLDKAKKMAEQAQAKLDDAQQQFNSSQQSGQPSGPVVEYDEHGRPIPQAPVASPHGDSLAESPAAPPAPVTPTPGVPPTGQGDPVMPASQAPAVAQPAVPPAVADGPSPEAPPAVPQADAADEDRNHPSFAPPKLTSGDPLAG
jgi:hypothetical protein